MIRIITSSLLLLLLLAAVWLLGNKQQMTSKKMLNKDIATATMKPEYIPINNSTSKYFMTVSGTVDPALLQHLDSEKVTAIYSTQNKACQYDASGGFEGAMTHRDKKLNYTIKPNPANGSFSTNIPLDKLLPGYCKWQIAAITYGFRYTPESKRTQKMSKVVMAYFNKPIVQSHQNGLDKWSCGEKFCKEIFSQSIGNSQQDDLSPFQNYAFQINFIKKGV